MKQSLDALQWHCQTVSVIRTPFIIATLSLSLAWAGFLNAQVAVQQIDILEVEDLTSGGIWTAPPVSSDKKPSTRASTRPAGPATRPVSQVVKPTLVTLDLQEVSVKSAFEELEKRSKIKLNVSPSDLFTRIDSKISIKVKDEPWLAVLLEMCEQASVFPNNYGDRWTISMGGDRRMKGVRSTGGPAMAIVHTAAIDSSIRYGTPPQQSRRMTLSGFVLIEPSLTSANLLGVRNVQVEDDLGRKIDPQDDQSMRQIPNVGNRRDFAIAFDLPDNKATTLSHVRGQLDCLMPTEYQTLKIHDLLKSEGKTFPLGSARFTIDKVAWVNMSYTVTISVEPGSIDPDIFNQLRSNMGRSVPQQSNNAVPASLRITNVVNNDDAVTITLYVRENKPTRKINDEDGPIAQIDLEWELPTEFQTLAIPLDLRDIPIPK